MRERAAREQREQLEDLAAAQGDERLRREGRAAGARARPPERMDEVNADPDSSDLDREEAEYALRAGEAASGRDSGQRNRRAGRGDRPRQHRRRRGQR